MTGKLKEVTKNYTMYIPDREVFDKLREDVTHLWYQKTGKLMTINELLIKSLLYFKSYLSDEEEAIPQYTKGINSFGRISR
jgi:hypothetical protein